MKKLVRLVIAGAVTVAVLGILFALLMEAPLEETSAGIVFTNAEPTEIQSVVVQNDLGSYRFYYEGEGYVLDDIPPEIANVDAFIAFMINCGKLSAVQKLDKKGGELADYGLAAPKATADITFFDGTAIQLAIGDMEKISQNYYATVKDFDGVYVINGETAGQFLKPKEQIISRLVTPELAVSSPLSAVRDVVFKGGGLNEPIYIQATSGGGQDVKLAAMSFGTATHIVHGTGVYQLDQTYGVEILGSLFGVEATGIPGYNLSPQEITNFGFDNPYMTVEYNMVNNPEGKAESCVLKLVKIDENRFYILRQGVNTVYEIGREPFIDLQYDKLILRWFLSPLIMDLSSVTVETPDNSYTFHIDNTDRKNPNVTYKGKKIDVDWFRSLFRLVTSAANDGTYLGQLQKPEGDEVLKIKYEYSEPQKQPDVIELYTGATRRVNVFVNGVGGFAMKDTFVTRVLDTCEDENILLGVSIIENW